jgi:PhnB protein
MQVQPYLFFDGRCEEAVRFYERALGAQVLMLTRNRDTPGIEAPAPGTEHHVNHAAFRLGDSVIMAADDPHLGPMPFRGFSLSIRAGHATEAGQVFAALADGGVVTRPLGPTFWSPCYGMVTDRFGIRWMVSVPEAAA